MAYNSYVTGTIEPARGIEELLEFLDDWHFTIAEDGSLENSKSGWGTGFAISGNELVGITEWTKTYGFDATFIEALVAASKEGLITYAYLSRAGEGRDDEEFYEYMEGQWKTAMYLIFQVPLGTESKARQIIMEASNAALGAM